MKRFTTDNPQNMNEELFNLCRAGEEGAKIEIGDDGELIDLAEYTVSIAHEFGNGCAPTRDDMFEGDYCMGCNYCPTGVLNLLGSVFVIQRELLRRFEDIVSNEHGEYDFEEIEKALETWRGGNAAIEQFRDKCCVCAHAQPLYLGEQMLYRCKGLDKRGIAASNGHCLCNEWEWNGGQEK